MAKEWKDDPGNYRAMSVPFPDDKTATDAINAFFADVRELRKKHKITDVQIVVSGSVSGPDGQEFSFCVNGHHGNASRAVEMLAWAFGKEQSESDARIRELKANGNRAGEVKK